jgi:hypothetical protein
VSKGKSVSLEFEMVGSVSVEEEREQELVAGRERDYCVG